MRYRVTLESRTNMKNKSAMSSGEFAKLCKTTKETLFHYDRENLLKPKYLSERGYRYYSAEQFFTFDIISILKEAGSSLKEIRTLIRGMNGERLLHLLEERSAFLKKKRERMEQREIMLNDMIDCTRESLHIDYDTFMVQRHEEECLEALPTTASPLEPSAEFAERFAEYIGLYEKQNRVPSYPFGVILMQADVMNGRYLERFLFSSATRFTPNFQLHKKPAGSYAVLAHRGTVHTHMRSFDGMIQRIRDSGLSIAGNAYVYDLMSVSSLDCGDIHSSKYCIRVE